MRDVLLREEESASASIGARSISWEEIFVGMSICTAGVRRVVIVVCDILEKTLSTGTRDRYACWVQIDEDGILTFHTNMFLRLVPFAFGEVL